MVLEVHYRFIWDGQRILSVDADILMGNISLPEDLLIALPVKKHKEMVPSRQRFHLLSQFFSVTFNHLANGSNNTLSNSGKSTQKSKLSDAHRSGNPGYEKGMPILTALYKFRDTEEKDMVTK